MLPVHVSLSTIPPRLPHLAPVLTAIKAQLEADDSLCVYVPHTYRRFGALGGIPDAIQQIAEFCRVEQDFGPATKILPSAQRHGGQDCLLVYCDDDRIPEPGWLYALRESAAAHPDKVIVGSGLQLADYMPGYQAKNPALPRAKLARKYAGPYLLKRLSHLLRQALSRKRLIRPARALYHTSGYVDIAQGLGGVAVRPHFFDDVFYDIPDLAFPVDDIWLSGNFARRGIGIWASNKIKIPREHHTSNESALVDSEFEGQNRQQSDLAVAHMMQDTYGVWG